jgi:hypothetical protein
MLSTCMCMRAHTLVFKLLNLVGHSTIGAVHLVKDLVKKKMHVHMHVHWW